jgi:hypothetical protein
LAERPAPNNFVGLFSLSNLTTLSTSGFWPLTPKVIALIQELPLDRLRRRRLAKQRVKGVVRDVLIAELPNAVAFITKEGPA